MAINQLKVGAALSYVSIALNMVIGLIYAPYMLRMLGQAEYGLYSLAASIIAYLTVLDLGFGNAIVRYTAKFRAEGNVREQQEMFGMFLALYVGLGLIAVIVGSILAINVEDLFSLNMTEDEACKMQIMLWLMTFNLAFTFPMSIWGSIMTAYEKFAFQRIVSIVRTILNPLVMVLLLSIGYKAVAMVVVTTLFNIFTLLINLFYCYSKLNIKIKFGVFNPILLKEISIYSFWIFLSVIMDRIYWSTGQFVLGIFKGTVVVAIYSVAIQLTHMFMMFSTSISGVFLPKVTAMVSTSNSNKEISDLFIRTGRIQYIIMSFILSAFIIFGQSFIRIWAGEAYEEAYYISLLFFFTLLPPMIQNLGITILQARNQMRFRAISYVVIAIFSSLFSIYGARRWGAIGCAYATAGALLLGQGLLMNIYYKKKQKIDIRKFWYEIIKMSVMPVVFVPICIFCINSLSINLDNISTFIYSAIIFTLLYVPLFGFISMNKYERNLFTRPINMLIKRV
ncbi:MULTISPECIES: oligosaccharide flippase family protein [Parabacteroides]|uniref:oligosaccharide flippase family protein n=1 Tax=Parabacteroides TaxID=375288 RepID=UPI000EFE3C42|nr:MULTISPECIES: oligosaccharide flippase family protein [Parabacteroides]RHU30636.1 flippase [Parabacteroides sp. TM07-1AC]WFE83980.1 oligosaccharide flippase family protein [Parabacteroides chongii]